MQPYTQYHPRLSALAKKCHTTTAEALAHMAKNMHSKEGHAAILMDCSIQIDDTMTKEEKFTALAFAYYSCVMDDTVAQGLVTHVYIPSIQFCNWLVGCVKEMNPDHLLLLKDEMAAGFVLHFHSKSQRYSCCCAIMDADKCDNPLFTDPHLFVFFGTENKKDAGFHQSMHHQLPDNDGLAWYARLIVGLGMYINCFPETVIPGVPTDLKHPSHHKHKLTSTISISPSVFTHGTHASPVGHFRLGHFRVLRSDRFTKKRFQTIFVRETYVKGRAETVLSPEETTI